jgi:hypothetical protein
MKWHGISALSVVTMLGFALVPGSAVSQQTTLKDQLVGTWSLAAWERTTPDGTKVNAYGPNPKGFAYYGADGRFYVLFTRGDLPKISANDRAKATPEEAKALVDGSIAYAGTYTVDEGSKTVALRLEATTFPNQAREQKRTITSISADEMKFTNPAPTAGGKIEVTMKRVTPVRTN